MEDTYFENPFGSNEIIAGAAAGFSEHFFMFPFDTLKTRLQSGKSLRMKEEIRTIISQERITHFYRGCVPILVSAVPAHAAYFGVYEAVKRTVGESFSGIAISAVFATVAHDVITTPFDVVKQRMQMDEKRCFSSSVHCAKSVFKSNGYSAFFRSLRTTLGMNIPYASAYWLVYEGFISHLDGKQTRDYNNEFSWEFLLAGSVAGAAASVVSFPLDTVKTHQQLFIGTTFCDTMRKIVLERGIRGVFSGVTARATHTSFSSAIVMVTYENLKRYLENN